MEKQTNMKTEDTKQQKKRRMGLIICLLLLLIGGGITYKVMHPSDKGTLVGGSYLPDNKDAKKMSKAELDKAAQKAVDESEFTLSLLPEANFPDGKSKGNIYIKNEATNAYPIAVEVVDNESGDVIYESGAIEPGYEITEGTLSKNLPKGKHQATAKVSIYDAKTKEFKGQTAAEMEIDVKA